MWATWLLAVMFAGCDVLNIVPEDKLVGSWEILFDPFESSYITINEDGSYKMMMVICRGFNDGRLLYNHDYYEGQWMLDGDELTLECADTIALVIHDIDLNKKSLTCKYDNGIPNSKGEYKGYRVENLSQDIIKGTWSFTDRTVFRTMYDMVMTMDETWNARMTFYSPYADTENRMIDWQKVDYTIVGEYIVFTGLTPMHWFKHLGITEDDVREFSSGTQQRMQTVFSMKPQDYSAHDLRLDGFIF